MEAGPVKSSSQKLDSKRVISDSALLFVAIVWGFAFVAQRIAAPQIGVFLFNAARFLLGALALTILAVAVKPRQLKFRTFSRSVQSGIILAGVLLAAGSAFQQAGLKYTTAANAGFITGLYVVFIPVMLAVVFKQSMETRIWWAALLAALGLFLLSTNGQMSINPGDLLVLLGSIFWAMHVILIGNLVQKVNVLPLAIGQYVVCGLLNLALGLWLEAGSMPTLLSAWWTVVYTGLISVGLGYTLQIVGQRHAPPADAAIILSLEAVFAALGGWIFLRESLSWIQISGCGLMLGGMLVAQLDLILNRGFQVKDGKNQSPS
jgi:drug/metabolite transporter (DMT)-like permease